MADESLRVEYQEMCKLDAAIRDFRARLLAALPLVSGTAAALLVRTESTARGWLLISAGLFGAAVTFGFFIFERQGQEVCVGLVARGREVESQLKMRGGVFGDRLVLPCEPKRAQLRNLRGPMPPYPPARPASTPEDGPCDRKRRGIPLSIPTASLFVYGATFLAWLGVVVYGVLTLTA